MLGGARAGSGDATGYGSPRIAAHGFALLCTLRLSQGASHWAGRTRETEWALEGVGGGRRSITGNVLISVCPCLSRLVRVHATTRPDPDPLLLPRSRPRLSSQPSPPPSTVLRKPSALNAAIVPHPGRRLCVYTSTFVCQRVNVRSYSTMPRVLPPSSDSITRPPCNRREDS